MAILGRRLCVAFPDTVLEEKDSQRDKTAKLGTIARACAIYGVDVIQIFRDDKKRGEPKLITNVLEYVETPQYLRKRLFPLDETLRFAGYLPPLKIPSHKPKIPLKELSRGAVREGVTNPDGTVDVGLDVRPRLEEKSSSGSRGGGGSGRRVTVRIVSMTPLLAVEVQRGELDEYWGYSVEIKDNMTEVFSDQRFGLVVATSRYGNALQSTLPALNSAVREASGLKLVFGSPSRGLFDMVGPGLAQRSGFVVNLFSEQHVETVRTEEAIFAALGLIDVLLVSGLSRNSTLHAYKGDARSVFKGRESN